MIKYFSQLDPSWARKTLGNTIYTIMNWGCANTTICNAIQKIYKVFDFSPKHGAELFKYTDDGKIIHDSIKFKDMKTKRVWGRPDNKTFIEYTNSDNKAIGVRMAYNPQHWILVTGWTVWWKFWFLAADPYSYNPVTKTCRIVRKLKRNIDGAFLFSKPK